MYMVQLFVIFTGMVVHVCAQTVSLQNTSPLCNCSCNGINTVIPKPKNFQCSFVTSLKKNLCQGNMSAVCTKVPQNADSPSTSPAVSASIPPTISTIRAESSTTAKTAIVSASSSCEKIASLVQDSISLLSEKSTYSLSEVIDHVTTIENHLWSLSSCNIKIYTGEIVGPDFHMAMGVVNSSATFNTRSTSVSINLKPQYHGRKTTAYAAELGLPTDVMSLFLANNQSMQGQQAQTSVTESTSLFPGTPFVSVATLKVNESSPMSRVAYTFRTNASMLQSSVSTLKASDATGGRVMLTQLKPQCIFLHVNNSNFSDAGCEVVSTSASDNVTCACNHTTLFAVLLTATLIKVPYGVQLLSYITAVTSILFASITVVILFKLRHSIKSDRTVVQINLCVSLLFLNLTTLLQDVAVANSRCCEMVTVFVHYFLLATGAWMSVDALILALKTSKKALKFANQKKVTMYRIRHLLGWIVPGIIVALATSISFPMQKYMDVLTKYGGYKFCWLSATSGIRGIAVLVPLGVFLTFNLVVAVKVSRLVAKLSEEQKNYVPADDAGCTGVDYEHVMAAAKALIMLMPVFGITWIFAFLAGTDDKLASKVFMYFNAIVNGVQGVFIFLVYCVANVQVRQGLSREMFRYRNQKN